MSPIIRRLRRLEDRFGTVETEHTRQLLAQLEAGRRRVAEWRAREGFLHRGRARARARALAEEERIQQRILSTSNRMGLS